MKLFSYVVARDFGFAPNPFYGFCTLACCKPTIRSTAKVGDWVAGTGSQKINRGSHLIYVMEVTETLSFDEYWNDPRFLLKRPSFNSSLKRAYGDNIYHRDESSDEWIQENSHHSFENGLMNPANLEQDTGSTKGVLISDRFIYWGGESMLIPDEFDSDNAKRLRKIGPGHKCNFSADFITSFLCWIQSLNLNGVISPPAGWSLHLE